MLIQSEVILQTVFNISSVLWQFFAAKNCLLFAFCEVFNQVRHTGIRKPSSDKPSCVFIPYKSFQNHEFVRLMENEHINHIDFRFFTIKNRYLT